MLRFWTGTTPRLVRLVIAGGVTFSVYEVRRRLHRNDSSLTLSKRVIKLIGRNAEV